MNLLVVGSVAYDTVTTPSGRNDRQLGGSATYFSTASSYLTNVGILAVIGQDFSDVDRSLFDEHGIDVSGLETSEGETFRWSGIYEDDLNTAITVETKLNVFADFVPILGKHHASAPFLFLANIDPRLQSTVLDQMDPRPKMVACDTMNLWIDTAKPQLIELISRVDVLIINEAEARQLTDENNILVAAQRLLGMGLNTLVIKRGEYGAAVFDNDFTFAVPAFPLINVIDPTGAGDSFAGGFLGYIAAIGKRDQPTIRRATIVGSVMASFAVERFGVECLASLTKADIEERFNAFVDLTSFDPIKGSQGVPLGVLRDRPC